MPNVTVDISDMRISNDPKDVLVTYALGSCLGLAIFDPVAGVGGMLHSMLPQSAIDPAKAAGKPPMFVDTGIPELFEATYRLGARKDRMVVKAAGCARILDDNGTFKIGERNYAMMRKVLWRNNVLIQAEEIGGDCSRTLYLEVGTGKVSLRANGQLHEL